MKKLLFLLERAIRLAVNAHAGQLDKAGAPYILHPLRVMHNCNSIEEKIVGILHDAIEDTAMTLNILLLNEGFPEDIILALDSVTHRKNEIYEDFIQRCKKNKIGRSVKIEDMKDNSDLMRMHEVEEKHLKMISKYHKGIKELRGGKGHFIKL